MAHVNKPTAGRRAEIFVGPGQCSLGKFYTVKLRHFRNMVCHAVASLQEIKQLME
jgi:hypothetical protein